MTQTAHILKNCAPHRFLFCIRPSYSLMPEKYKTKFQPEELYQMPEPVSGYPLWAISGYRAGCKIKIFEEK